MPNLSYINCVRDCCLLTLLAAAALAQNANQSSPAKANDEAPVPPPITPTETVKASVTSDAVKAGWTTDSLCDEAFGYAGLTLGSCPRAVLSAPPTRDPFKTASVLRRV